MIEDKLQKERLKIIDMRIDAAMDQLKKIRKLARNKDEIGFKDFTDLQEIISSLRHNCDVFNDENGY